MKTIVNRVVQEHRLIAGFILSLVFIWAFGSLASEMIEGDTSGFDKAIVLGLRHPSDLAHPIGPAFLKTAMIDITALGSETVLALVAIMAVAFMLLRHRARQALLLAAAIGGGAILSGIMKTLFARPRPQIVPHLVEASSPSFPSGHAMNSAIIYLTIAVLLARAYRDAGTRAFVISLALLATLTIGFSRVYLGVHWPSDVIAGWLVGSGWALAMGLLGMLLQRRRQIEQPTPPGSDADSPEPISD